MKKSNTPFFTGLSSMVVITIIFLLMVYIPGTLLADDKNIISDSTNARFKNTKFDFGIQIPDGWIVEEENTPDTLAVSAKEPKFNGIVIAILVDLQGEYPVHDFISATEDEFSKELPYIRMNEGKEIPNPFGDQSETQLPMVYREYRGDYQDTKMKALAGYAVKGKYGYSVVGVHAESDRGMKSFRLN